MGYTHYWRNLDQCDVESLKSAISVMSKMINNYRQFLTIAYDDEMRIYFNGIGDDEHEAFVIDLYEYKDMSFDFCKTARKPYDRFVVACLCILKYYCPNVIISSDGDYRERKSGIELAKRYLPKCRIHWGL